MNSTFIAWTNTHTKYCDNQLHYTYIPDINISINDIKLDMFPTELLDSLFCIVPDNEKKNYNTLKTLLLNKNITNIVSDDDKTGKHPFLKYTKFIETLPNGNEYINDLKKVIVYPIDEQDCDILHSKELRQKYHNICLEFFKNK